jgi:phosphoribosylaminoimidazole-succinocarboxamide synthase
MPTGSSLIDRLEKDPSYALELGIEKPVPGAFFAHPVVEFYTKLEPKDRLLSWQEAALMSQLDGTQLEHMVEVALDVALALFVVFAELGIELWDGKVEMVEELGKDTPLLADSIGPDELRLLYKGCHLSKEMIRQIYKDSEWKKKLKDAQDIAKTDSSARSWKEIAVDQLHAAPERLRSKEKAIVDQLYGVLANTLVGKTVFKDHPTLEQFVQELPPELRGAGAGANAGAGSATKTLLSGQSNRSQGG